MPSALFDIRTNQSIISVGGAGYFKNAGAITKSTGNGTASIAISLHLVTGSTVEVKTGEKLETPYLIHLIGAVQVDSGGTLAFDGGVEQDGGTVTDNGTITAFGDYLQNAGTFTLSAGTLTTNNDRVAAGAVLSGYGTVNANVFNAGEIDTVSGAPSPLYVFGAYTQTAGSQTKASVTNVNYSDTLWVTGLVDVQAGTVNVDLGGSNLIAKAGFTQEGGLVDLNAGTITVTGAYAKSGGLTTLEAGTLIADGSGDPNGYGLKVTGTAVLSGYGAITAKVLNASEIDAQSGTLAVTGAYKQTGGVTNVANGATLSVTGTLDEQGGVLNLYDSALHVYGGYVIESGALLDGGGLLIADVTNSGVIVCGSATTFDSFNCIRDPSNGISGNYTQTATGVLDMKLGAGGASDGLGVDGLASLGGTFNLSVLNGFTPSPGAFYFLIQGRGAGGFAVCNFPVESNGVFLPEYNGYGMAFYLLFQGNQHY